jgi:hypothetical protein
MTPAMTSSRRVPPTTQLHSLRSIAYCNSCSRMCRPVAVMTDWISRARVAERWPEGGAALRDREILCTVVEAGRVVIFDIVVTPGSKTADGLQVFASDRPV